MENMIKFYRGLVSNLPTTGVNGALYITTDEGAIYYGTGTGMKRLGDFIQVANVAALPEKAHESCLYYCVAENILAKWNGSEWKQINKQPTAEELKTLLGLGSLAYLSEVSEDNLNAALKEKVNAASGAQHTHANKDLLDTYTQTEANLADAVAKKHSHTFVESELNKIVDGDVAKWNAAEGNAKSYVDEKIAALDYTDTAVEGEYVSAVNEVDGKISVTRKALPDYTNVYEAKGEAAKVQGELNTYKEANDIALANVKATAEAAYVKPATGIAKTDLSAEVQNSLGKADTALQSHQDISHLAVKSDVETELGKKVDKTVYEGKVSELEGAINGKVAIETGKSLVLDTEITKLAGVSEGANKVENVGGGKIKIDGQEVVVYAHPEKHAISEVDGLQAALDGKQAAGNYSEVGHKHVKADITDFAHTHTKSEITDFAHTHVASEITDLDATIKGYDYATKTELGNVDKKFENYNTKESQKVIDDEQDRRLGVIEGDYLKAADIANFETKENVKKVSDALAEYVESNNAEVAEVRGIAEAARTESEVNGQIDAKITALNLGGTYEPIGAETRAKAYVDQEIEKANLGQYTTEQEVKDIIDAVVVGAVEGDTLTGLANLVEYINTHGGEASEMAGAIETLEGKVETIEGKPAYGILSTDIAAWNGEIGAKALAETKTTTAEVKSQIEAYGYATESDLTLAEGRIAVLEGINHEAYKAADETLKTEVNGYTDGKVKELADGQVKTNTEEIAKKANSADVYAKTETYTQAEIQALLTWGEF